MQILNETIEISTRGFTDIIDITSPVADLVASSTLDTGQVLIFVPGSTGAVTTIEYEPGLVKDIPEILDEIAPVEKTYHHDETWGDGNGYAHVRAALIGPSLMVPFIDKKLQTGTWQQIVFIDFDNKERKRQLIVQLTGE